jgi:hypothetical protein
VSSEERGLEVGKDDWLVPHELSPILSTFQRTLNAHSISKTVAAAIQEVAFYGQVWSCFPAACNLVDEAGRVVSLVTSDVGDGPLNVVVEGKDPFDGVKAGMEARIEGDKAVVGNRLVVDLDAEVWEPVVLWGEIAAEAIASLWDYVQDWATSENLLAFWVPAVRPLRGVQMAFQETARDAAERLLLALRRGDQQGIVVYALTLAGLGPGATPAGDDFLVGLMAGLRAWPQFLMPGGLSAGDACVIVSQAVVAHTNVFSAAHLRAAGDGQMGAGWHRLAAALTADDKRAIQEAAESLLAFGATSGADAMAGFVGPYLLTGKA